METYTLTVLVALFFGVMGIIAMMERRRRTELAQFEQFHKTLSACLGSLQAIHASSETRMDKVAEALSQLRAAIETGTKSSSESAHTLSKSAQTLSSEAGRAVEQAVVRFETALLQHQKAQVAASASLEAKLSDVTQSTSKELLAEAQRVTKALQELQASLEASIKF